MEDISEIQMKSWKAGKDNFFKFWKKLNPLHLHDKYGDLDCNAMDASIFYYFINFLKRPSSNHTNEEIIKLFFRLMRKHETKENICLAILESFNDELKAGIKGESDDRENN